MIASRHSGFELPKQHWGRCRRWTPDRHPEDDL